MSRSKIVIALIAGSLALGGAAYANEQRSTPQPHATHGTDTQSAAALLPIASVLEQLTGQGYSGFTDVELDDGKYELEGRDTQGRKVEIDVDARTGAILKVRQD